jgi:hypothetical protein
MALTRVTSTVLESNAVSAEKMANGSIVTRLYGIKSIEAKHLAASANTSVLTTSINVLQDNINVVHANVVAAEANIVSKDTVVLNSARANDLITFTRLDANINVLQGNVNSVKANVDAAEANIAAILTGNLDFTNSVLMEDDLIIQGNLTVLGDSIVANTINSVVQDRFILLANSVTGTPSADVGIFMNRGTSGNAAIFYDESAKSFTIAETRDPDSNTVISPTGLANLAVGTLKYSGADLNTAITDNRSGAISTVYKDNLTVSRALASDGSGKIIVSDVTSAELGYLDGVSSAIQTQLDTKIATTASASNDYVTYTRLNANINVVSSNIAVGLARKVNVISSADGEGSGNNNFFVATPSGGNPSAIDNISVSINGVMQAKTTDYLYTAGSGKVTFKDALIPDGLIVQITSFNPPT